MRRPLGRLANDALMYPLRSECRKRDQVSAAQRFRLTRGPHDGIALPSVQLMSAGVLGIFLVLVQHRIR